MVHLAELWMFATRSTQQARPPASPRQFFLLKTSRRPDLRLRAPSATDETAMTVACGGPRQREGTVSVGARVPTPAGRTRRGIPQR